MKTIICALFFLSSTSLFAQGLTKEYLESCDCYLITNHYDNGQMSAKHHENKQGVKHGEEVVFYPNGHKQYERVWKNGKLDGIGVHYHQNGNIYYQEEHLNGKKSGEWTFKDENGALMQVINYSGTKDDGTYHYYHAGVEYFTQVVSGGKMVTETILNQAIYDQLVAEAEAAKNAKK